VVVEAVVAPRHRRKRQEGGFALLLVFLMAGVFAITLYLEIPRIAMETERAKEQILIDRGEQYKRAIQLFTKKAGRYPGRIEELESFQNQRFLRRRYIDPMTGKDEWRLIHIQNGILTDSKLSAPQKQAEEKKDNGSFSGIENSFGTGPNNPSMQGGAALTGRRRASDGGTAGNGPELPPALPSPSQGQNPSNPPAMPGMPGQTGATGQPPLPGAPPGMQQPNQPGQTTSGITIPGQQPLPGQPGGMPGPVVFPGQPGAVSGRPTPGQQPGGTGSPTGNSFGGSSFGNVTNSFGGGTPNATGTPALPGQVVYPGGQQGQQGLPAQPGAPVNSQTGGQSPYSTTPGANGNSPGIQQPGVTGASGNQATDMINRILTTPRPGGMPTGAQTGGAALGGGIAGVASNAEGEAIMVYNDRSLYQEWEFVFDPAKVKQIPNPNASGAGGTPADRMGNTPGGPPGTPVQPGANGPAIQPPRIPR